MLGGRLVELAPTEELFAHPVHPYTRALLSAIHIPDPDLERNKTMLTYDRTLPVSSHLTEVAEGHFAAV